MRAPERQAQGRRQELLPVTRLVGVHRHQIIGCCLWMIKAWHAMITFVSSPRIDAKAVEHRVSAEILRASKRAVGLKAQHTRTNLFKNAMRLNMIRVI